MIRGKMRLEDRTEQVYLCMYSEAPNEYTSYVAHDTVAEFLRRDGKNLAPVTLLFGASLRVYDREMIIRGFRRSGLDRKDYTNHLKPDQEHQSVIVHFVPDGADETEDEDDAR